MRDQTDEMVGSVSYVSDRAFYMKAGKENDSADENSDSGRYSCCYGVI